MASYLTVVSNDTLTHRALDGSPETLCGRPVVTTVAPRDVPELNTVSGGPLTCDVCSTLSDGGSLMKETVGSASRNCPHCEEGYDDTGGLCWNCGGSGWLEGDDFQTYLNGINEDDSLQGTKVAQLTDSDFDPDAAFDGQDIRVCDNCGEPTTVSKRVGNEDWCMNCTLSPTTQNTTYVEASNSTNAKVATNWTRDGTPIENGFEVVTVDKEQAARTPFLDFAKVNISERRDCPDCGQSQWLSKVASCDTCGQLKCNACMDSIGASLFVGMCKVCAGAESDLSYETGARDPYPAQDLYLQRLMSEDDDGDFESLFLPSDPT